MGFSGVGYLVSSHIREDGRVDQEPATHVDKDLGNGAWPGEQEREQEIAQLSWEHISEV